MIPIINDIADITLENKWELISKNELINDGGKVVRATYHGRQYQIILAKRDYHWLILAGRIFAATLLIICTFATALFFKQVQNLFCQTCEKRKYRLLIHDPLKPKPAENEPNDEYSLSLLESLPTEILGNIFKNLPLNDLLQLDQTSQTISTHIAQNALLKKHMVDKGLLFYWHCSEKTNNPDKSNLVLNSLLQNYFRLKTEGTLPLNYRQRVSEASPFLNAFFYTEAHPNFTQPFPIEEKIAKQRLDFRWGGETLLYALFDMVRTKRLNFDLFLSAIEKNATIASVFAVQLSPKGKNLETLFDLCKLSANRNDLRGMNLLFSDRNILNFALKKYKEGFRYPPLLASFARSNALKFQFKKAFCLYRKAIRAYGNKAPAWVLAEMGFVLEKLAKKKKAAEFLKRAVKINICEIPADALIILANNKFQQKNWPEAIKLYQSVTVAFQKKNFFMLRSIQEENIFFNKLSAKTILLHYRSGNTPLAMKSLEKATQIPSFTVNDLINENASFFELMGLGFNYLIK